MYKKALSFIAIDVGLDTVNHLLAPGEWHLDLHVYAVDRATILLQIAGKVEDAVRLV